MSYKLNKTDGSLLVDLVDGQLDTTSSDLTLIGRNYSGFGEFLNENFIKLLENFSKEVENFKQICPIEMLNKLENPITVKKNILQTG